MCAKNARAQAGNKDRQFERPLPRFSFDVLVEPESRQLVHYALAVEQIASSEMSEQEDLLSVFLRTFARHGEHFGCDTVAGCSQFMKSRVRTFWDYMRQGKHEGVCRLAGQSMWMAASAVHASKGRGEFLRSVVCRNAESQLLLYLPLYDRENGTKLCPGTFPLLRFLSRHRMPHDSTTVWLALEKPPLLEDWNDWNEGQGKSDYAKSEKGDFSTLELLKLASNVAPLAPEILFVSGVLLAIARRLAEELPKPKNRRLLQSPTYRKVLWESLDAVLWHETMRGLYATIMPDWAHLPIGEPPAPASYLWLIAEYGYVVLGVDRDLAIHKHFRRAEQHESLLYHSRTDYRDHLFHAIETFLFGYGLLTSQGSSIPRKLFGIRGKPKNELLRNWFLASLCHDFGYVMEMIPSVLRITRQFDSQGADEIVEGLGRRWQEGIAGLHKAIHGEMAFKSRLDDRRPDHGLFSYLHLRTDLQRLDSLVRDTAAASGPPAQSQSEHCQKYADALVAIAKHNLMREPIHLDSEPLAGLLVLCDEIQEWQRPRCNIWELSQNSVSLINFGNILNVASRRVCEGVVVEGCTIDEDHHIHFANGLGKIVLRYADQNQNVFEPLTRLLSKVYNIERIEGLSRLPLILEIWIPKLDRRPSGPYDGISLRRWKVRELDILRDFCLLNECGISPDLYSVEGDKPNPTKRCHCYSQEHQSREYDVVHLKLGEFPPRPRSDVEPLVKRPPWEFEEALLLFKREYCRRNKVECSFFNQDDDWPERQIADVSLG